MPFCWSLGSWGFVRRVPPGDASFLGVTDLKLRPLCAALMEPTVLLVSWLRSGLQRIPLSESSCRSVLKNGLYSVYLKLRNCCEMRNCFVCLCFFTYRSQFTSWIGILGIPMFLERNATQSLALAHPAKILPLCLYSGLDNLAAWRT